MRERNLLLRVVSAVIGLPLLGALVFWREPLGFGLFALLAGAVGLSEYGGLALGAGRRGDRMTLVLVGTAFMAAVYLWPSLTLAWAMGAVVITGLLTVLGADDVKAAAQRLAVSGFGVFYVGGLLVALPLMHRDLRDGSLWVTLAIAVTFANDTGAYIAGRTLGRHKLAPAISPGKTLEGAIGGLITGVGFTLLARATFFPALTVMDAVVIGVVGGVIGPTGDLMESLLKRAVGAKDSGRIIPGHGGVLDRIDALLFVGAYVYVHARFIH